MSEALIIDQNICEDFFAKQLNKNNPKISS